MALGLALRAFFKTLVNHEIAERVRVALDDRRLESKAEIEKSEPEKRQRRPSTEAGRSEALTLLSTLQREARFLDLVQEALDEFDDAQVGAAAREVVRDCRKSLQRMFAIEPLAEEEEGASLELGSSISPAKYRLVGKSEGSAGTIAHRGWQATRCEVPTWNGDRGEALILAPIEVDVD